VPCGGLELSQPCTTAYEYLSTSVATKTLDTERDSALHGLSTLHEQVSGKLKCTRRYPSYFSQCFALTNYRNMALHSEANDRSSQEQNDVITPLVYFDEGSNTQIGHDGDNGIESNDSNSIVSDMTSRDTKEATESITVVSKQLESFSTIFYLALLYSVFALFAWTVTCYLAHWPIGASTRYYGKLYHE
jgi:hypothetical protein